MKTTRRRRKQIMPEDADKQLEASNFLRREIWSVIKRYNEITCYQLIGVLETVKMDVYDNIAILNEEQEED